jgi:DNA-binding NtrC family response regulator
VTERLGLGRRTIGPDARRRLLEHDWPGNVRELEHAVEQAVALAPAEEIGPDDLPTTVTAAFTVVEPPGNVRSFKDAKCHVVETFERRFLADALSRNDGNVSKTAEEIGMYRQHLQQKLSDYGIDASTYRPARTK